MNIDFETFLMKFHGALPTEVVLGLDPGETTGVALFHGHLLVDTTQLKQMGVDELAEDITAYILKCNPRPDIIVIEDYRVYSWRAKEHSWDSLYTARLIGAIQFWCKQHNLKTKKQTAQNAKMFVNDKKLRAWNFWIKGQKHTRDAIRHAVYYICFDKKPSKPSKGKTK